MGRKPTSRKLVTECIFTALMLLMEKEEYDQITITEIAKRAGVSRMAFYRIYHSKDDILKNRLEEIFQNMLLQIEHQQLKTKEEFFTCFFTTMQENTSFFRNVMRANLFEYFWKKLKEHMFALFFKYFQPYFQLDTAVPYTNYRICFFTGGFMHIVREWAETGMKEDIPTMVDLSCEIIEKLEQMRHL